MLLTLSKQNGFVEIRELNFFGQYNESSNGEFLLAWENGGCFVSLQNGRQISKGKIKNPSNGQIADNGTYLLVSQQSKPGDFPRDALLCLDVNGAALFNKQFEAAIMTIGISTNGKIAACQTAFSNNNHSMQLMLIDLISKGIRWQTSWGTEWPKAFKFIESSGNLILVYPQLGEYEFDSNGKFLSLDNWEIDRVILNHGKTMNSMVEHLIEKGLDVSRGKKLLESLIARSKERWFHENPKDMAYILRSIGEVQLALGCKNECVSSWESAVMLNPKIGLQRKLQQTKKATP